jgi:DNA modification methylase
VNKISDLIPDPKNANKGTARGRGMLETSLQKYGAGRSILIDKNNVIIAGNKTAEVAGGIGMENVRIIETDGTEIIAVKRTDLDANSKQGRELAIADNRVGEVGLEWNPEELAGLKLEGVSTDDFFSMEEFAQITGQPLEQGLCDPDDAPEPPAEPKSHTGELWALGEHRLFCGDSGNDASFAAVLKGDLATCIFTDPPYGVSIGKKNVMLNSFQPFGRNLTDIESDDLSPEALEKILFPIFAKFPKQVMAEDCSVFTCSPQDGGSGMMMMMMMQKACLMSRHVLIWKKNSPTFSMGHLDYDYAHEPILLTWGKKHKRPMGGQHRTSVWEIDKPRANKEHPTMKPVELYVNAFLNNSERGDVVFDPFGGSGTCIIAAEQTERKARVIELMPAYCDVILSRWAKFTGKDPVREDGAKWSEINL